MKVDCCHKNSWQSDIQQCCTDTRRLNAQSCQEVHYKKSPRLTSALDRQTGVSVIFIAPNSQQTRNWTLWGVGAATCLGSLVTFRSLSEVMICRSSRPQKWYNFHERYAMCWNEWKINFLILIFSNYGRFCSQFSSIFTLINDQKNIVSKDA